MSTKFKVGDKVRIIKDTCHHGYIINTVCIIKFILYFNPSGYAIEEGITYIQDEDIELVAPRHVCQLVCNCNPREAVSL